jgi:hypothetical protein
MPGDTTRRVPADQARRQARIALGKDPDDMSDVYRGRPTRPKPKPPTERPGGSTVPVGPIGVADAAAQLGIRPVVLAQAISEGRVAIVHGRKGEVMIARDKFERIRRVGLEA